MSTKKNKYTLDDFKNDIGIMTFGRMLESHRLCEDMNQKEFAKLLGISPSSLCDLERGRKIPSAKRAADMAEQLGMPPLYWIQLALEDQLRQQGLNYKVNIVA
jgi:transcriptional regulator with XRE-family HTH domain